MTHRLVHRGRRRRGERGFTLLEILVAVAILSVALVSVLALHARNVRLTAESQDLTIAGLLASKVVALTRVGDFPEYGMARGTFETEDDDSFDEPELDRVYGGALAENFFWEREVTPVGLSPMANLRQVRIAVGIDEDEPLAEMNFLVRRRSQ